MKRFLLACLRERTANKCRSARLCSLSPMVRRTGPKASPLSATAFGEEFKAICERVALRTRQDGSKVYCLDVKLVA